MIVGHFAMLYHNEAEELGIDLEQLYAAMVQDSRINPPEWNIYGRQSNVYKYVRSRPAASESLANKR